MTAYEAWRSILIAGVLLVIAGMMLGWPKEAMRFSVGCTLTWLGLGLLQQARQAQLITPDS